jgi:predicted transcriptional regulator
MSSSFKKFVENLVHGKAPGPATSFSMFHFFLALELMAKKPIGRNKLAKELGVGDGAVRTIVKRLKDVGLITTTKEGCQLTEKGLRMWKTFEDIFPKRLPLGETELTKSDYNFGFLVKDSGHKVRSGIEQRDAAIMGGAKRAIVIVSKENHLVIESISNDVAKQFPKAANQIMASFKPRENDVIVIASAESVLKAKRGAFAASWVLVGNRKQG